MPPVMGMSWPTEDEDKVQRESPFEKRMSGNSNSCLILESDRFKGECSQKGVELPFLSELTEATCGACAKYGECI